MSNNSDKEIINPLVLYQYKGISIILNSNQINPIKVTAEFNNSKIDVELYTTDCEISKIKYVPVADSDAMPVDKKKELKYFIKSRAVAKGIIHGWCDYFVWGVEPKDLPTKIWN